MEVLSSAAGKEKTKEKEGLKMEHSQGKWRVVFGTIEDGNGKELFHQSVMFKGNRTAGEAEANAKLIAAAPELLEACKKAKDYLQFNKGNSSPIYDELVQVIAKAEGKL